MTQVAQRRPITLDPVGYGAMSLADTYGPIDEATAVALLHAVADAGVSHIDTANIYGDGESERIIGKFLRERGRESVFLASKTGLAMKGAAGGRGVSGHPDTVRTSIDGTLQRLGTDHVDLYYQHRIDPDVPVEDTVGAFAELVEAGKIRHVGLSEATASELRRADSVHPIAAVQSEWNILSRDVEVHVVPTAAELGVAVVPFSPLSRALLTDGFDADAASRDLRRVFPRFSPEHLPTNLALVEEVREIATRRGVATEQVAVAWLLAKAEHFGAAVSVIPGTRSIRHFASNLGGRDVRLSADDVAALDTIAGRVAGARSATPMKVSGGREGLI